MAYIHFQLWGLAIASIAIDIAATYFLQKEVVYVHLVNSSHEELHYPQSIWLSIHKSENDEPLHQLLLEKLHNEPTQDAMKNAFTDLASETDTIRRGMSDEGEIYKTNKEQTHMLLKRIPEKYLKVQGYLCLDGDYVLLEPANINSQTYSKHYATLNKIRRFECLDDGTKMEVARIDEQKERNYKFALSDAFASMPASKDRTKREVIPLTIELLLVIDYAAYTWWANLTEQYGNAETMDLIRQYYAYIFQGIDLRFSSIEKQPFSINVAFSGLLVAKSEDESYWTTKSVLEDDSESPRLMVNSSEALEKFQRWLDSAESLPKYDHAILFTGTNLSYAGSSGNTGLAFASSMCRNISNSSIVEDSFDFRTITFATQQIARSLGSRDDMDNNDCLDFFNYIMAPRIKLPIRSFPSNRWQFSSCTEQYLNEYVTELTGNNLTCLQETILEERYPSYLEGLIDDLPGFTYSGKKQCEHVFGLQSDICRKKIGTKYTKICEGLLCSIPGTDRCDYILPADGTHCGNKKYCFQGSCSEFDDATVSSDTCAFGNDPQTDCKNTVTSEPYHCYDESIRFTCCDSCEPFQTEVSGCEYGDRHSGCSINACANGNRTYIDNTCCMTCADGPTPYASPSASTVTEMSPNPQLETVTSVIEHPAILSSLRESSSSQYTTVQTPSPSPVTSPGYSYLSPYLTPDTYSGVSTASSSTVDTTTEMYTEFTTYVSHGREYQTTTSGTDKMQDLELSDHSDISTTATERTPPAEGSILESNTAFTLTSSTREMIHVDSSTIPLSGSADVDHHASTALTTLRKATVEGPVQNSVPPQSATTSEAQIVCACTISPATFDKGVTQTSNGNVSQVHCSTTETTQSLKNGIFLKELARSMKYSQRQIRHELHQRIRALYWAISGQLRGSQREYENENESGREASEVDDDLNKKLKHVWRQHYKDLMRDLDKNVRDMRYKVLSLTYKHLKLKHNRQ